MECVATTKKCGNKKWKNRKKKKRWYSYFLSNNYSNTGNSNRRRITANLSLSLRFNITGLLLISFLFVVIQFRGVYIRAERSSFRSRVGQLWSYLLFIKKGITHYALARVELDHVVIAITRKTVVSGIRINCGRVTQDFNGSSRNRGRNNSSGGWGNWWINQINGLLLLFCNAFLKKGRWHIF